MENFNYLCVKDFGAAGDGFTDDTPAFQKALDKAGETGDTVYAPPGKYLFKGVLNVPVSVTLMGSFGNVPAHNGIRDGGILPKPGDFGTAFFVAGGGGSEEGSPFITLNTNSVLKGVLIYYPGQDPEKTPVPYPYCIAMRGKNPAVLDTELLNPYNGIDASQNERHFIARVYGQPLRRGIFLDGIYDIGRIEDVHFNPWWSVKPAVIKFMVEEGEAFILGRTDWEYMVNCFSIIYKAGFVFRDFGKGGPNVDLTQCGHDISPYAVIVENTTEHAGISFSNCQFMGEFLVKETNKGPVRINGCGFWGTTKGDFQNPGTLSNIVLGGDGHVIVNGCHFTNLNIEPESAKSPVIDVNCRSAVISSCDFLLDKVQINVGENVKGLSVIGNKFKGPERITGKKEVAQSGFNMSV
jgi:hypothetical protein